MPKLSAADLKELFDIVSDIKEARLTFCLSAAERTLRKVVTDAVYDATTPSAQVEGLKFAEAHFAVYHLLLNAGLRLRRSGLIKIETDAGGSVTNNARNEFYTPDEIKGLRDQFFKDAEDAATPYQPVAAVRSRSKDVLISGGWA